MMLADLGSREKKRIVGWALPTIKKRRTPPTTIKAQKRKKRPFGPHIKRTGFARILKK